MLFGFLYFGIRWQSQPPAAIEAELWTPLPNVPAPVKPDAPRIETPPESKPEVREEPKPVPKPDIAVKEEKKKPEPKKETPKPRVQDDPIKQDLMKEQLARELQRENAATAAAREAAARADSSRRGWEAQIAAKVRSHVRLPDNLAGNPEAVFDVRLLPNMEILRVKLFKSSGNPAYDEAAERAINASSPLPPPPAGVDPGRVLRFPFRPKN
jgi:colicin import membrane protein